MLAWCFETLDAETIWAGVGCWNEASLRVLSKLGFRELGEIPGGYQVRGEAIQSCAYELPRHRWRETSGQHATMSW